MYDLVIIGAAAAGCSAAVYAARRNLNFVVIAKDIGGEVALSGEVENWPGTIHTTGIELAGQFHKHAQSYETPFEIGVEVISIEQDGLVHVVVAKDSNGTPKTYRTKAVLIGSGIHPRELHLPGEKEFKGRGVTSCTVCDGPLYKGKTTATIGAGNSALESALMMSGIAKQVYLLTKYPDDPKMHGGFPKGEDVLTKKVKALSNVTIKYSALTQEIMGGQGVTALRYQDANSKEETTLAVQGVMVHIGAIPNTDFATGIKKNQIGEIEIDLLGRTNIPGIFAAGDVTSVPFKQIAIAAGHGVTAALAAIDFINHYEE